MLLAACSPAADRPAVPREPSIAVPSPTTPVGEEQLGEPVRVRRVAAPPGARAWRIRYRSRSIHDRLVPVGAVILAPEAPPPLGGYPVVAWGHGNVGLADRCAPSRHPARALPLELWRLGWVVVATDYEGLGTPGLHPKLVGVSEGRAMLDAVRAAQRIPATGAGDAVLLFGHSQGGHAALFAAELAPGYAPELELAGVVASAPAAELRLLVRMLPPEWTGFAVEVAAAYEYAYGADPGAIVTEEAAAAMDIVERRCVEDVLERFEGSREDVLAADPSEVQPWSSLLLENSPGRTRIDVPVLLLGGGEDTLIPPRILRALLDRMCAAGTAVELSLYRQADHGSVLGAGATQIFTWIESRLLGATAGSGCAP